VFFASVLMSFGGVAGRDWITYTHSTAFGVTQYNVGAFIAVVATLCGLLTLSWTEQRPGRAFMEAVTSTLGFIVPIAIFSVLAGHAVVDLLATTLILLLLFTAGRFASLIAVRTVLRRLVLSAAPLCSLCGYDLTGNVSGVCPECGRPVS